jgi:hypothetical protein
VFSWVLEVLLWVFSGCLLVLVAEIVGLKEEVEMILLEVLVAVVLAVDLVSFYYSGGFLLKGESADALKILCELFSFKWRRLEGEVCFLG